METTGENSTFSWMGEANITSKSHSSSNLGSVFSANRIFYAAALVEYYYTPLLCFVGAMGNCLSVAVFCFNANQRSLSSSYYLSALAISDTGFLINLFVFWLDPVGVGVLSSNLGCPFIMFSSSVFSFLSVWLTVAFTIERFFAVCSPLHRPSVCTVSKAKKVIFSLTTFALLAFSYTLVIAQVVETGIRSDDYFVHDDNEATAIPAHNHSFSVDVLEQNLTTPNLMPPQFYLNNNSEKWTFTLERNTDTQSDCSEDLNGSQEGCYRVDVTNIPFDDSSRTFHLSNQGDDDDPPGSLGKIHPIGDNGMDTELGILLNMHNSTTNINLNGSDKNDGRDAYTAVRCTVPSKYITFSIIANYLDSVITLIIPFCLITYFNMRIAVCIWKLKDERKQIVARVRIVKPRSHQPSRSDGQSKEFAGSFNKIVHPQMVKEDCEEICGATTTPMHCDHVQSLSTSTESANLGFQENSSRDAINTVRHQRGQMLYGEQDKVNVEENQDPLSQAAFSDSRSVDNSRTFPSLRPCNEKRMNICSSCANRNSTFAAASSLEANVYNSEPSQSQQTGSNSKSRNVPNPNSTNGVRMTRRGNVRGNTPTMSTHSSEARVTKMLLLVSTVFLLLNLPSHAIRLTVFFQSVLVDTETLESSRRLHAAQQLSNVLLFNTNFAVNFFLYCLSGRNFRKSLWNVLFGRCHKKSRPSPSANANIAAHKKTVRFGPKDDCTNDQMGTELVDMPKNRSHNKPGVVEIDLETVKLGTIA